MHNFRLGLEESFLFWTSRKAAKMDAVIRPNPGILWWGCQGLGGLSGNTALAALIVFPDPAEPPSAEQAAEGSLSLSPCLAKRPV